MVYLVVKLFISVVVVITDYSGLSRIFFGLRLGFGTLTICFVGESFS